jgi:hypothetical protein
VVGFRIAALLLCTTLAAGQKSPPRKVAPQALARAQLPTYDIVLSPKEDISTSLPDEVGASDEQCDASGNVYFSISQNGRNEFLGLTSRGVVSFSAQKIIDIPSPETERAYVTSSGLYVLTTGREPARREDQEESDSLKTFLAGQGPRLYIARFDLDGSYKSALKLDFKFISLQLAAFDSGSFLVAGLDEGKAARVALLDSTGQMLKYLELPKDVADNPKSASKSFAPFGLRSEEPPSSEEIAMSGWALPYRGAVLFLREADFSRIYEIRNTCEVRMVKIRRPADLAFDGILQSDRNWFAYVKDELYEIDPETGELLGHFRVRHANPRQDQLACFVDGKFVGLRHKDGRMTLLTGTVEAAVAKTPAAGKQ